MRLKKLFCLLFAVCLAVGCLTVSANAAVVDNAKTMVIARATGRFNVTIPGKTTAKTDSTFPLEKGEQVHVEAAYSPEAVSVDFGFIAPDGKFYSVNTKTGSFDEIFEAAQSGEYTFTIRNNSAETVKVSGTVRY